MAGTLTKAVVLLGLGAATASANPGPHPQELLSALLSQAAALTASLTNVAENLGQVKGSVVIQTRHTSADLVAEVDALIHGETLASVSRIAPGIRASQQGEGVFDLFKPATLASGEITTTAIGALQSGALIGSTGTTGTVDTSGLAGRVVLLTEGATARAEQNGSVAGAVILQNVAVNLGDIDGSVQITLADTQARLGQVGTTAIGAMETGMLTASLTGNMGEVTDAAAHLVADLVGP
ncbi:hypothetical protein NX862_17400 [Rhodobacter sp. KR11]|uniref:hypothetical protein n=1 Tax=Rhodobacter sp. KR11 TaxID=2974588 RepID=UPI002222EC4F|nr:hypothetical protein [Rhodobacter sp. KR11]MCW1920537.1 hypothetical protein [Rhodobacter sp. KR11]